MLADELIGEGAYLPSLDAATRREVVEHVDSRLLGFATPHDLFGLVLVMLDLRPACIVSTMQPALTVDHAERIARDHEALVDRDLVGQFLEEYEVPYALRSGFHQGRAGGPAQVFANYHVSFDESRLAEYESRLAEELASGADDRGRRLGSGLPRGEEEALGRLLGYPEPAIRAYCDGDHHSPGRGQLLDTLSDAELAEALGPSASVYDALGLDYREFTRLALPYVVPETVPECLDRVVADASAYLFAGLVTTERYGMDLFSHVLEDYHNRVAPSVDGR